MYNVTTAAEGATVGFGWVRRRCLRAEWTGRVVKEPKEKQRDDGGEGRNIERALNGNRAYKYTVVYIILKYTGGKIGQKTHAHLVTREKPVRRFHYPMDVWWSSFGLIAKPRLFINGTHLKSERLYFFINYPA